MNNNPNPNPNPDVRRLLGGYATGNLSEAEAQELLQAAMHDQELFDALADEQALRDLLDAPGVKQELIAVLRPSRWERFKSWMATPMGWGAAGVAVATAALTLVIAPQAMRNASEPAVAIRIEQDRQVVAAPEDKKEQAKLGEPQQPLMAQRRRAPVDKAAASKPALVERKEERTTPAESPAPVQGSAQAPLQAQQQQQQAQQQQQQLTDEAEQQRAEPRRQMTRQVRDAAPRADVPAEQAALAGAAKTAESVQVSASASSLDKAQPLYVLEARDAGGTFVALRRPVPGRVRLRVNPAGDGFAMLQLNRDAPLRVPVRAGVPALLPSDGLDVKTGDRLQLTFLSGQGAPGTPGGPAGFRAGNAAKQAPLQAPILIRIGADTEP